MVEDLGVGGNGPAQAADFEESIKLGYELTDAYAKGIVIAAAGGLLFGVCIFLGVGWMFNFFERDIRSHQIAPSALKLDHLVPPEPRLELNPNEDLIALRKQKLAIINSAGWIDRKNGWVHISIDDAMKLLVEEEQHRFQVGARKK